MAQSSSHPESSEPTLSTNPTRPPSRQSTRVITPVKTHPLYIRPNNDTRRSLAGQSATSEIGRSSHSQITPLKSTHARASGSKSKRQKAPRSAAISPKRKRVVVDNSDESSEADSDSGVAIMDLAQDSDEHNSKMEPPTKKTRGLAISEFDDVALYFEPPERAKGQDALLHISFNYARRGIKLFTRTWAASEAHRLYLNLKQKVMDNLNAIDSKMSLIHDVWTTKGNRHAFLGISTTDSGSNNRTMTAEVDRLVNKFGGTELDLTANHIRCLCHKLGLILTAGLNAIDLETTGLTPEKHATLGFVPGLDTINEVAQQSDSLPGKSNRFNSDDEAPPENIQASINDPNTEGEEENSNHDNEEEDRSTEFNSLAKILQNVDYVISRITSSAAKRSQFSVWAKKLEYEGRSLIAGYGIRWNIKWQSRDRAYEARDVIAKLLELERVRHSREGGKHFYQEVKIRWSDWEIVKQLNDILSEFYFITKKMEGDHSSASRMLAEYQYIKQFLTDQLTPGLEPEFEAMIRKMISKTQIYLTEALQCDAILLATILHPSYRLSIFERRFTTRHMYAKTLLQNRFTERQEKLKGESGSSPTPPQLEIPTPALKHRRVAEDEYFPESDDLQTTDELATYLGGKYGLPAAKAAESLKWWKAHHHEFPVLSSLAKDYLACSATSASVERCFSAAADICGRDRGSLAARTTERCVNSHEWLQQKIQADGDFDTAQQIVNCISSKEAEGSQSPLEDDSEKEED
ncbi:hypothetical protein MJO28_009151 [Puccinia striiformis f. sp. tritici]|uniref:Uncharacterized protein n=1 Tax=Puccinia striiformis f. sp. tritici TaxID=168172 RepID=A0ACC0E6Q7_9BASI|nr:hypothetical protein MJO28_009151 [Puccinia striiformis f. sp. tritici]